MNGLYIGNESEENVVHGRVWRNISGESAPQSSIFAQCRSTHTQSTFHVKMDLTYICTPDNINPNILTGAIVGGPNGKDEFEDVRDKGRTTYTNAAFVGTLAYFAAKQI
ncbi:hypothetical protein CASFOL_016515 [Castilleja foliolosa]|uniref:cellulase n=1 Tax=Castilleja foliolosa TaxID=1961234 RepID=A0ABD3D8E9_9LAMI